MWQGSPASFRARCYVERVPDQHDPFPSCAVCGRTILKGEQAREYVSPQGQLQGVCVLCRSRAEASDWIPADRAGAAMLAPPNRQRRGDALRKRIERAASRARAGARRGAPAADGDAAKNGAPEEDAETTPAKPRPRRGPEALMSQAVKRFNDSDERRKVAGLVRSLGEPRAAVRPDAGRQMTLVTVAWELSWYQWEVGGDGRGDPVREVAKGDEVSELTEDAQAWNAAVTEDGELRLSSSASRRQASGKKA
jgi:hypothetical protein